MIRSEGDPAIQDKNGDEVYDYFQNTLDFYFQALKRDSIGDQGFNLIGSIHYDDDRNPTGYDNAFWNGQQMVFGDGDGIMFGSFTKSLDVIGHELTHGVTQYTASLPYHRQSGALNESISDVFGSMVKQYTLKQIADEADWLIGKELLMPDILAQGNLALRSMREPGKAFKNTPFGDDTQPGHMQGYQDLPDDPTTTLVECISTQEFPIVRSFWWPLLSVDLRGSGLDQSGTQPCWIRNSATMQMLLMEQISPAVFLSSQSLPAPTHWNCSAAMFKQQ
jgi:Zn-dependent metalloprotease